VEPFQGGFEPFIVSSQAAEAGSLGEGAFDDPAAWQQHEEPRLAMGCLTTSVAFAIQSIEALRDVL
jgi:hypothetical protein